MNILHVDDATFRKKVIGMEAAQLDHALQQYEEERARYTRICANYPPGKYEKYAIPFLQRIQLRIDLIKELQK